MGFVRALGFAAACVLVACGGDRRGFDEQAAPAPRESDGGATAPASASSCTPSAATPTALASSLPIWNLGVAVDDDAIFFRTFGPHTVWRMPASGGDATRVWSGAVGIFGAGLEVKDGFAYWSGLDAERDGLEAVFRAPASGGAAQRVGTLPSLCAAYGGLAVDDTNVYAATIACSLGQATVSAIPLGGGDARVLFRDDAWTIGGLALAHDAVVITAATGDGDSDEDDVGSYGEVLAVPKRGGPARVLAHVTYAGPIATDGDSAYWIDEGALFSAPLDGSGGVATLASGLRPASSIAVDARGVYVGVGGTRTTHLHQGSVAFVPKSGGSVTVLAKNIDQLGDIRVQDNVVYFSTLGSPDGPQHGGVYRLDACRTAP
jgi:hypothetical protein